MAVTHTPMTAAALRDAERATMAHTPEHVLMDRAAAAIAREAAGLSPVALLIGGGNNGGDALLAGALLARAGAEVTAVLLTPDAHPRGLSHLAAAGGWVVEWSPRPEGGAEPGAEPAHAIRAAAAVIDGIVGIGGRAGLRADAQAAVAAISPAAIVIAVDLPSGLDPDTGVPTGTHVSADVTVTFTAPKVCLVEEPAATSAGRVVLADVGVDLLLQ